MIHSFLLIGQSNAAGRGLFADAEPLDTCDGKLLVARNGLWLKMFRPLNPDRKFSGTCLAETFAKAYSYACPDVQVGIVPCADGGTALEEWQPGEILFENAVNCARLAMRTSKLQGVLWHQGESDCCADRYPLYYEGLRTLIDSLRASLDIPELPFLMGGLGDFLIERTDLDYRQYYPKINDTLLKISQDVPACAFVPATGLSANPDNLHFNATSLSAFGYRYFEAYKGLCPFVPGDTDLSQLPNTERTEMAQL